MSRSHDRLNGEKYFAQAVAAGVDEITHIPLIGLTPIAEAD
jgi:hypothetical protein